MATAGSGSVDTPTDATESATVEFNCIEGRVDAALKSEKVIHFKGFSRGLHNRPVPQGALDLLLVGDVIVFDGDDFGQDSFTKALPMVAVLKPGIRFIAYKYETQLSRFLSSWHGLKVTVPSVCARGDAHILVPIMYVKVPDIPVPPGDNIYITLGHFALKDTGSDMIISWGGGEVPLAEWQLGQKLERKPTWHVFPTERIKAGTNTVETSALLAVPPSENFIVYSDKFD